MYQHHLEIYRNRWQSFGWEPIVVDEHNLMELLDAYERAQHIHDRPTVILARTIKGKGLPGIEDKNGYHGKALKPADAEKAIASLQERMPKTDVTWKPQLPPQRHGVVPVPSIVPSSLPESPYAVGGDEVPTRKAFGNALAALGKIDERIVVLDGDVENSTYTEEFQKNAPGRFYESYIAEQNMIGVAMGLAARCRIPFASTFACFLTRAYDFIRLAAISHLNIKLAGTHVGVSIGEDGPSQTALEDLAMTAAQPNFTLLYPADATSAWHATQLLAYHLGPSYLRLGRPKSPVL
jgi:transketolase